MKKLILNTTTIALLTLSIGYTGCKKGNSDTTNPVVTLNGEATTYCQVNKTFTDPGATGHDDTDGSVSVTETGTVNTATLGTYVLTYTAKDAAGNKGTALRTVYVVNFDGIYNEVQSGFTPDTTANGTGSSTVSASGVSASDGLTIGNFDLYLANTLNATFSGTTITVPIQATAAGSGYRIQATGTITGMGTVSSPLKFTFQSKETNYPSGTTYNQGTAVYTHN